MIINLFNSKKTETANIRIGEIISWGDSIGLYTVRLASGITLYNVSGPDGLTVGNWTTISTESNGQNTILNQTKYDSTEIIEVTV